MGDHRAVLDQRPPFTTRTEGDADLLFDRDLAGRTSPGIGQDADAFRPDEMRDDLVRIDVH
jgi:hypothetical protein